MDVQLVEKLARQHLMVLRRGDRIVVLGLDAAAAAAGLDARDYLREDAVGAEARLFFDEMHRIRVSLVEQVEAAA